MAKQGNDSGTLAAPEEPVAAGASVAPTSMTSRDLEAVKVGDIRVKAGSDDYKCDVSGCALLPGDKMILADFTNANLKLIDINTSTILSDLRTSQLPWDVASITDDQAAATLRDGRKIAFVNVTSSALKLDREISVDGRCTGIAHSKGKLFVAFCGPKKLEIMTLDGAVETKVELSNVFNWPSLLALSPGHDAVYVTENERAGGVKRLSLGGTVEAEYQDETLMYPKGVVVDQQGRVLVCGSTSDNVHLLTADLNQIKLLVDEIDSPQSLSLCHSSGKMYVGRSNDNVSVYQLS